MAKTTTQTEAMLFTKAEFEALYYSCTNVSLSKKLGVSAVTIRNHAKKLGLRKRPAYARNKIKIVG